MRIDLPKQGLLLTKALMEEVGKYYAQIPLEQEPQLNYGPGPVTSEDNYRPAFSAIRTGDGISIVEWDEAFDGGESFTAEEFPEELFKRTANVTMHPSLARFPEIRMRSSEFELYLTLQQSYQEPPRITSDPEVLRALGLNPEDHRSMAARVTNGIGLTVGSLGLVGMVIGDRLINIRD